MLKILVFTSQIPYPWWFYGRSSFYFLIKSLAKKNIDIHLSFPVRNIKENEKNIEHLKSLGINVYPFEHNTSDRPLMLLKNLFENEPFKIKKYWNENYYDKMVNIFRSIKPDIIQVHTSHMFKYGFLLSKQFDIPIVLRQQDIVHNQIKTYIKETKNLLYKTIAAWQYRKTLKYELEIWDYADKIAFLTKQDYDYATETLKINPKKCIYIYDGIELKDNIYLKEKNKKKAIVFMASDQVPNIISLRWFIDIWKEISHRIPFEFHVYGKICNIFEKEKDNLKNYKIFLKGFIEKPETLHDMLAKYYAFISPTIQGSGYRTKIFEAMSIGIPVICTQFDYKPIEPLFEKDKDIFVFNEASELLKIIYTIEDNSSILQDMSKRAYEKIEKNHTWDKVAEKFIHVYSELLNKKR